MKSLELFYLLRGIYSSLFTWLETYAVPLRLVSTDVGTSIGFTVVTTVERGLWDLLKPHLQALLRARN